MYKYIYIYIRIINVAEQQLNLTDITIHICHGIENNTFSYHHLTDIHFLYCHCHLGDTLRMLRRNILNFTLRTIQANLSKKCVLPLKYVHGKRQTLVLLECILHDENKNIFLLFVDKVISLAM